MKGKYIPFNDGFGIVGWHYKCPKCSHITTFIVDCSEGCEKCGFEEPAVDPNDWYEKRSRLLPNPSVLILIIAYVVVVSLVYVFLFTK